MLSEVTVQRGRTKVSALSLPCDVAATRCQYVLRPAPRQAVPKVPRQAVTGLGVPGAAGWRCKCQQGPQARPPPQEGRECEGDVRLPDCQGHNYSDQHAKHPVSSSPSALWRGLHDPSMAKHADGTGMVAVLSPRPPFRSPSLRVTMLELGHSQKRIGLVVVICRRWRQLHLDVALSSSLASLLPHRTGTEEGGSPNRRGGSRRLLCRLIGGPKAEGIEEGVSSGENRVPRPRRPGVEELGCTVSTAHVRDRKELS